MYKINDGVMMKKYYDGYPVIAKITVLERIDMGPLDLNQTSSCRYHPNLIACVLFENWAPDRLFVATNARTSNQSNHSHTHPF